MSSATRSRSLATSFSRSAISRSLRRQLVALLVQHLHPLVDDFFLGDDPFFEGNQFFAHFARLALDLSAQFDTLFFYGGIGILDGRGGFALRVRYQLGRLSTGLADKTTARQDVPRQTSAIIPPRMPSDHSQDEWH